MKKLSSASMLTILGFVIIFSGLGLFLRSGSSKPLGLITDVAQYSEIIQGYDGSILVQHFPRSIPPQAQNVHLEYVPRIMQGGSHFQLRLKLSNPIIHNLYQEFAPIATHTFKGGDTDMHSHLAKGVPTTYFYTNDTDDRTFPPSYEILVLAAKADGSSEVEWNHGYSYGVAIDVSASEIVYWNEAW